MLHSQFTISDTEMKDVQQFWQNQQHQCYNHSFDSRKLFPKQAGADITDPPQHTRRSGGTNESTLTFLKSMEVIVQTKLHFLWREWCCSLISLLSQAARLFCRKICLNVGPFHMIRFVPGPVPRQPTTAGSIPSTSLYWGTDQPGWVQVPEIHQRGNVYVYSHTSRVFMHLYLCYTLFWLCGRGFLSLCTPHRCSLSATLAVGTGCTCICSAQYQACAGGLLLFLLIISRPHSADHHSFIPQILTWDGRVFVAGSCCLQELLLHQCQIVNFNVTCHFSPPTVFFLMVFTSNLP